MRKLLFGVSVLVVTIWGMTHRGGSCGRDAIPSKIAINAEGTPVLSCDSPACIGRGSPDNMRAECEQDFTETVCVGEDEWTAGLIESTNGTHITLRTLCCMYEPLANAKELQTVLLYANESFEGGIVEHHGRMTGFDLVKEVRKSVDEEGIVQYIVTVFRMACHDEDYGKLKHAPLLGDYPKKHGSFEIDSYFPHKRGRYANKDVLKRKVSLFPENGVIPEQDSGYGNNAPAYDPEPVRPQISGPEPLEQNYESGPQPPPAVPASQQGGYDQQPQQVAVQQQQLEQQQPQPISPSSGPVPPAPIQNGGAYATAQSYPAYNYPTAPQSGYPASYSYPSSGYCATCSSGMKCFSRDMIVQTPAGYKRMDELEIGDHVLSIDENMIQYSPVVMFLHKKEDVEAEFYKVQLKNGEFIELTEDHLIYKTDCERRGKLELVYAKDLKAGMCLDFSKDHKMSLQRDEIVTIEKVRNTGIYAPLTATGDIFVNNILASCHTNYAVKSLQQTFFAVYRMVKGRYDSLFEKPLTQESDMPYGAEYLSSVLDLFVPKNLF